MTIFSASISAGTAESVSVTSGVADDVASEGKTDVAGSASVGEEAGAHPAAKRSAVKRNNFCFI
ncbi:MAG: hypothetical protein DYG86_18420 [Chloroflexi bacterium CFX2]|nr:hypothetical protein [Chloroflexi bacterium CFX2]